MERFKLTREYIKKDHEIKNQDLKDLVTELNNSGLNGLQYAFVKKVSNINKFIEESKEFKVSQSPFGTDFDFLEYLIGFHPENRTIEVVAKINKSPVIGDYYYLGLGMPTFQDGYLSTYLENEGVLELIYVTTSRYSKGVGIGANLTEFILNNLPKCYANIVSNKLIEIAKGIGYLEVNHVLNTNLVFYGKYFTNCKDLFDRYLNVPTIHTEFDYTIHHAINKEVRGLKDAIPISIVSIKPETKLTFRVENYEYSDIAMQGIYFYKGKRKGNFELFVNDLGAISALEIPSLTEAISCIESSLGALVLNEGVFGFNPYHAVDKSNFSCLTRTAMPYTIKPKIIDQINNFHFGGGSDVSRLAIELDKSIDRRIWGDAYQDIE